MIQTKQKISLSKRLSIAATVLMSLQFQACLQNSALAEDEKPFQLASAAGVLQSTASLKSVGPLEMSNGIATLNQNRIFILSDRTDPLSQAELVGELLNVHFVEQGNERQIHGTAVFSGGPSISALDAGGNDSLVLVGGDNVSGHIESMDASRIVIKSASGIRACRLDQIAAIKSTRAFDFTLPASTPGSDALSQANLIVFTPTQIVIATNPPPLMRATLYKEEPGKHHAAKQALKTAGIVAALFACFGVPAAVAISTKHTGGLKGDL